MTRHWKQKPIKASPVAPEQGDTLRLRFRDRVVELIPTTAYPFHVLQAEEYEAWVEGIADLSTSTRINSNVDNRHGTTIIILLGGGDKGSQQRDIVNAMRLWERVRSEITQI